MTGAVKFKWESIYKNVLILEIMLMPIFIKDIFKFRQFASDNNIQIVSSLFFLNSMIAGAFLFVKNIFYDTLGNKKFRKLPDLRLLFLENPKIILRDRQGIQGSEALQVALRYFILFRHFCKLKFFKPISFFVSTSTGTPLGTRLMVSTTSGKIM
jgi:hypothetical protein